jgi:hypothetical protein
LDAVWKEFHHYVGPQRKLLDMLEAVRADFRHLIDLDYDKEAIWNMIKDDKKEVRDDQEAYPEP